MIPIRTHFKRLTALILVLTILVSLVPPVSAMVPVDLTAALNNQPLYPQRTGYIEVDRAIEQILAPYKNATTYEKVKACYDWAVKNIYYSWHGYSKKKAPAYEYFALTYDLTHEEGLQNTVPMDMIYRSYHALTEKKGVCYDYSILFAVMCRYIGIDAYVHTGYYAMENWSGSGGLNLHHGWTQVIIGGQTYIFDLQREYRYRQNQGRDTFAFFGIPLSTAWRYDQETALNTARDASMLSVTAHRHYQVEVNVIGSASGSGIQGVGKYQDCANVTLSSASSLPVTGWYDLNGTPLHMGSSYTFVPNGDRVLIAMFSGDRFIDMGPGNWFYGDVMEAAGLGLVKGTSNIHFSANDPMTRAMAVEYLARASGEDTTQAAAAPFTDVPANEWYANSVNWAYENEVVMGTSETTFSPEELVTREDFVTMLMRYLRTQEEIFPKEPSELSYTDLDSISGYALEPVAEAQALELVMGYPDGSFGPTNLVNRAEGVTFLMRMLRCVENWIPWEEEIPGETTPDEEIPEESTPEESLPDEEIPEESEPEITE